VLLAAASQESDEERMRRATPAERRGRSRRTDDMGKLVGALSRHPRIPSYIAKLDANLSSRCSVSGQMMVYSWRACGRKGGMDAWRHPLRYLGPSSETRYERRKLRTLIRSGPMQAGGSRSLG